LTSSNEISSAGMIYISPRCQYRRRKSSSDRWLLLIASAILRDDLESPLEREPLLRVVVSSSGMSESPGNEPASANRARDREAMLLESGVPLARQGGPRVEGSRR
jgi:hypothetical protein